MIDGVLETTVGYTGGHLSTARLLKLKAGSKLLYLVAVGLVKQRGL